MLGVCRGTCNFSLTQHCPGQRWVKADNVIPEEKKKNSAFQFISPDKK